MRRHAGAGATDVAGATLLMWPRHGTEHRDHVPVTMHPSSDAIYTGLLPAPVDPGRWLESNDGTLTVVLRSSVRRFSHLKIPQSINELSPAVRRGAASRLLSVGPQRCRAALVSLRCQAIDIPCSTLQMCMPLRSLGRYPTVSRGFFVLRI